MTTLGPSSSRFTPAFTFSAIAVVIATLAVLVSLPSIVTALLGPGPDDGEMRDVFTTYATDKHLAAQQTDIDRINGRSAFFRPSPRVKTPEPRPLERDPKPIEVKEPVDRTPPIPRSYGGPEITAVVVDEVWFGETIVRVGQTVGDITVVSVANAPFAVELKWRGWHGDVEFISRADIVASSRQAGGNDLGGIVPADDLTPEQLRELTADGAKKAANSRSGSTIRPTPPNRGSLTREQRRRARQSDPNPSVPDE